ncbi:hypothetical protein ABZV29_16845 [Streptomyces sp. NPDC005236]|uniref:hypothetical protein n=1 Tax=Streptomyces sp. NPDC005236 TaxID=3157028 RepID=UPI0033B1CD0F
MTLTSAATTDGFLRESRGQRLIDAATSDRELAAAQALVEEETILAHRSVQRALGLEMPSPSAVRWEGLAGRVYGLGLDEEQRAFLGLALSMLGIGHVSLAAVSDLGERRLAVMLRAIARLAGNDTLAVGTRV